MVKEMKYLVLLCDGMSDYPVEELAGKTPMEVANKPAMDHLAARAEVGLLKTVAEGLMPGSDVANLSVMGYDPFVCYAGRSPLEAASIGIDLAEQDVATRCNLVTLSEEAEFSQKTMVDYCADDISTEEAEILIKHLQNKLGDEEFSFYTGVSYRHCLVWKNGPYDVGATTPPHDITAQKITGHLPHNERFLELTKKSYELLHEHPLNLERIKKGHRPANCIWLWGSGRKKPLADFGAKYGVKGSVISAVDLIKGIGRLANLEVLEVEGATGYLNTNFSGKAQACIDAFARGQDFVYLHVEAPDECGHRAELNNKIRAIEQIDLLVLTPILNALARYDDYKIMILPDHATPLALRTHVSDPVPYLIYHKQGELQSGVTNFCEQACAATGVSFDTGHAQMGRFLKK